MSEVYTFLGYALNTGSHKLTHNRKPVDLRPKTIYTLEYLLTNRHRVVSKDDLLNAVWPNAHVQEQAVFQSISELRTVFLGKTCIETVRGRGYRWIIPLDDDQERKPPLSGAWKRLAASVAALGVAMGAWFYVSHDPTSLAIVIRPAGAVANPSDQSTVASSMDDMLVQHLRRMGWNAQRAGDPDLAADSLVLDVYVDRKAQQIDMKYVLRSETDEESSHISSTTPLGAVRDLAAELHESLALRLAGTANPTSLSRLLRQAKLHLDNGDYKTAEAYLVVVSTESPSHLGAKHALAYTYQQTNRSQEALALAYTAYAAAKKPTNRADRMTGAILLSQLLGSAGRHNDAERFAREALNIATEINDLLLVAEAQEQLGELSIARGELAKGKEQLNFALQYYNTFCPSGEARVSDRLLVLQATAERKSS